MEVIRRQQACAKPGLGNCSDMDFGSKYYVPIYDSVLLTIALIVTLGTLRELEWKGSEGWFFSLALLIIAVSWVTEPIAQSKGIQLLTVLAFAIGCGRRLKCIRQCGRQPLYRDGRDGSLRETNTAVGEVK